MKHFSFCFFLFLSLNAIGQSFQFPTVDYDDVEIEKDENTIFKKTFKKDGTIVMEAHYPYKGSIQSLCHKSNVVSDSVYIIKGEMNSEIQFYRPKKKILVKSWKTGSNLVSFENYFKNKKLEEKYQAIAILEARTEYPACVMRMNFRNVGEHFKYDEDGKEVFYKNYDTGVGRTPEMKAHSEMNKKIDALKKKADAFVADSYGKKFFKSNIKIDYNTTLAYHSKSRASRRNNGYPSANQNNRTRFMPDDKGVTYVDFAYSIQADNEYYFNIIKIRVDSLGNIIQFPDNSNREKKNFTRGLINPDGKRFLSKKDILKLVEKEGLPINDPNLKMTLTWTATTKSSSTGSLKYQILFDKYPKIIYGCNMVYHEEWLVDAFTGAIEKDREFQDGECAISSSYRKKEGDKFGFVGEFDRNKQTIPFEYEMLPRNMSYCMIAKKEGKYGCIDNKNETLINFEFDYIKYVSFKNKRHKEDFLIVKKGDKHGLFSKKGKEIFSIQFTKIEKQSEYVLVAYDGEKVAKTFDVKAWAKGR